jgi:hypothetical protein
VTGAPRTSSDPLDALTALPGVADAVEAAREAVERLLRHRVLRRGGALVAAESSLRGARASAALEGADVPLAAARAFLRDGSRLAPGPDPAVVVGALRVSAELTGLVPTWRRAPLQALARVHLLAASDLVPAGELGRPRGDAEVSARLVALAGLAASPSSAPAVVAAAVVHGELLALRPFGTCDGVVARAAGRLVLLQRSLDSAGMSVPEVGHLELGADAYADAAAGYAVGTAQGVRRWVIHVAQAVALGAREGIAVCEAVQRGAAS